MARKRRGESRAFADPEWHSPVEFLDILDIFWILPSGKQLDPGNHMKSPIFNGN